MSYANENLRGFKPGDLVLVTSYDSNPSKETVEVTRRLAEVVKRYYGLWEVRWKSGPLEGQTTTIGGRGIKKITNAIEALGLLTADEMETLGWADVMKSQSKDE